MAYILKRRCNNNVVEAIDAQGCSVVVTGRGVGFGLRPGQEIPAERIQLKYVLESQQRAGAIADALAQVSPNTLALARKISLDAQQRFGISPITILLPLAEHLEYSVLRARRGDRIDVPLAFEVSQLYPGEYEFGMFAVKLVCADLGISLPCDEAAAFAMHIVSAQFHNNRIGAAMRTTQHIAAILRIIEEHSRVKVSRADVWTTRFITHIRFLLARLAAGTRSVDTPQEIVEAIKETLAASWLVAQKIKDYISEVESQELSESEVAYLTLHIGRFTHTGKREIEY
ncbi:PRD domain-containing protein [Corynebacterium freiburgense]|uniref:PRD domain-containing protein n=1 Tax=Corynebacterium freiburgense TaxID=556548 RepID=UPI0004199771|nr:PRD domain-containing protein [Corynebacterium freiburgense]WJZ03349.1 Cryptic beta-glucoside bgl operon antiterminator [Corynebacterium freiburgense]